MFNLKNLLCATILFCFSSVVSNLNAETVSSYEYKVGDLKVIAVEDTSFYLESSLIANGNPEVVKKYMPEGKIMCSVNVFIVKDDKQTVLIDAGMSGNIASKLINVGISPDSVSLILLTHGHGDHSAGLVNNGKAVFPNAEVLFSEKEKPLYSDSAIAKVPAQYQYLYMASNQTIKVYGNKVKTFPFGKTVSEGIKSVDLNGHTPGHSGFLVESKGQKLLIAGDFLHIGAVQFSHPEYSLIFDADIKQAVEMRKQTLNGLAAKKLPFAATHLPFPGIGTVSRADEGFAFLRRLNRAGNIIQ